MTSTATLRSTWLIQRLNSPSPSFAMLGKDNPFAFGGGLRNGGLSEEAMDLLRPIFSFDYMGAAEFEFGAVPQALQKIAKASGLSGGAQLTAYSFTIPLKSVAPHWREDKKAPAPEGSATIYVLAPKDWIPEVKLRIREWAKTGYGEKLKEPTFLAQVLRPDPDPERSGWNRTLGWLELDNGFMFFADAAMFHATTELFGVAHE